MINKFLLNKNRKKYNFNYIYLRYKFIYYFILLSLILLLFKITFLQIISSEKLTYESDIRTIRKRNIIITRGKITDRFGKLLAYSIQANCVWVNPNEINRNYKNFLNDIRWNKLAKILSINLNQLIQHIQSNSKKRFIYLARQINTNKSEYIKKLKLNGIHLCIEEKRCYPKNNIDYSLLGFTDIDGTGIEGVEKSFDKLLKGTNGKLVFRKSLNGNIIEHILFQKSKTASTIKLSINSYFQSLIHNEINNAVNIHKALSGSAVLIDILTGEVLAMVNSTIKNINKIKNTRNFTITDMFEPGSTIKPIVLMTALKNKIVNENSIIETIPFFLEGHEIRDVTKHDKLSLTEILKKSSNVGVSKLSLLMPIEELLNSYTAFGLSKTTNLGLIGESKGFFPKKKMV